jgi:hypothetical protein
VYTVLPLRTGFELLIRPMKFEMALRFSLLGLCAIARKAESITIKNSVLLRRLNEPIKAGRRENTLRLQTSLAVSIGLVIPARPAR